MLSAIGGGGACRLMPIDAVQVEVVAHAVCVHAVAWMSAATVTKVRVKFSVKCDGGASNCGAGCSAGACSLRADAVS